MPPVGSPAGGFLQEDAYDVFSCGKSTNFQIEFCCSLQKYIHECIFLDTLELMS